MDTPPLDAAARALGLSPHELVPFGPGVAKLSREALHARVLRDPPGRIVLVSAMNPTPHGEGKTTVSIGLGDGLRRLGHRAALALREPSIGPVFGIKGGGTGGGRARLVPSERINLHFTGDLHAITAAHNLLAALIDNAIFFRGELELEHRRVLWRRVLDSNDRFLRHAVIGLGGRAHGMPREESFDITAASEVMAVLCLADGYADLKARLGRLLVGYDRQGKPVTAADLRATGAMAALLADALLPNLVTSAEGCPAFVHGGPFGNIAHGCSSVLGTRAAASLADVVVTEAGFGFDLGAEKFFDIKCRSSGLWPSAVVLVVSARALRFHGGDGGHDAAGPSAVAALERGLENLDQHVASVHAFGLSPIVAINVFAGDDAGELDALERALAARSLPSARVTAFAEGGRGAESLAARVAEAIAGPRPSPRFLYALEDDPVDKLRAVARTIYGARDVTLSAEAKRELARVRSLGHARLPVCIAKTHLSLSDDPAVPGRPRGFDLAIRSLRVAAGGGYLLALSGDIVTMPGLPAAPAAMGIDLTDEGEIVGLG